MATKKIKPRTLKNDEKLKEGKLTNSKVKVKRDLSLKEPASTSVAKKKKTTKKSVCKINTVEVIFIEGVDVKKNHKMFLKDLKASTKSETFYAKETRERDDALSYLIKRDGAKLLVICSRTTAAYIEQFTKDNSKFFEKDFMCESSFRIHIPKVSHSGAIRK